MDLCIKTITGEVEMLTDYGVSRKNGINGEKTIDASVTKTDNNEHSYPLIKNENIFIYDNDEYIIKIFKERAIGDTKKVECKAIHRIFDDLKFHRIYEVTSGTIRIEALLGFSLDGSGYTFSVDTTDLPLSVEVENFGDDSSLSLLKSVIEKFGAEFDVIGKHIYVAKQIGRVTDHQVRHKLNIKDPTQEINSNDFSTYIRGYGKKNEDGTYAAYVEYTSPLAEIYGIKHAPPVRDERFTDNASLLVTCQRELHDSLDVSIQLTYIDLQELGIQDIRKGDYVWCILDPFEIYVQIRVVDVEDFSDPFKSPVFTLGTITKKATDIMVSFNTTQKTVEKVVDTSTNKVKQSALSTTTNYVVDAIERTFSQIDYSELGIMLTEAAAFMRQVRLKKGGIFVSTDGVILTLAVSPDGVNMEAAYGILSEDHVSIGPGTSFAEGYDPSQITVPEYQLATEDTSGLMSHTDKSKLNQLVISQQGQVIDLSILLKKIDDLEERVTAVEGGTV
ncbi:phage tail protein [Metabacillus halosaccharovorans]|uniref:phage tail spike protein n=1 Tax=Metabacillus halosaccharovorans TaxID=930124 RepID=UPI00403E0102